MKTTFALNENEKRYGTIIVLHKFERIDAKINFVVYIKFGIMHFKLIVGQIKKLIFLTMIK